MRVLFVAALPPERSSMVGRIMPLAQEIAMAGHTVEILTLSGRERPPYHDTQLPSPGVTIRTVGPALRATGVARPHPLATLRRFYSGRAALSQSLIDQYPDVVILAKPHPQNTMPVLSVAARQHIPLVVDLDDREPHASRMLWVFRGYFAELEIRAIQQAAAITAASPALIEDARRIRADAQIDLLLTGISLPATLPPAHLRERLKLPVDAKVLLYVGSLSLSSGHRVDTLLTVFEQLAPSMPNTHLVFAGDGIDGEKLQKTAERGSVRTRIHFLGRFVPPEDIALAREADVLVDPVDESLTNAAKSSHRVMLALATGTPVVAGNVGIRPFLLPQSVHTVCLYAPDTPDAFRRALARALTEDGNPVFRQHTAGLIEQWTWPVLGRKFVHILESLVPGTTPLAPRP